MYAAMLKQKLVLAISEANLVHSGDKQLNRDQYYCPKCKKRVMLVLSQEKMPFFKHFSLIKGEGEKEEHQQTKQLLCASLVANGLKAEMEVPLAQQQLRADVLVYPNLAFEVQCAPLSWQEFNHRHHLYQKIGIKDVWIVGKRHYLKKKLNDSQKIFFRYSKFWDWYYLEADPFKEKITLKYHIRLEPVADKLIYHQHTFVLNEQGIQKLFSFRSKLKFDYQIDAKKQKQYLIRQLQQKTNLGKKVAALMYQNHLTVDDLPNTLFKQIRLPNEDNAVLKFLQAKRDAI